MTDMQTDLFGVDRALLKDLFFGLGVMDFTKPRRSYFEFRNQLVENMIRYSEESPGNAITQEEIDRFYTETSFEKMKDTALGTPEGEGCIKVAYTGRLEGKTLS